MKQELYKDYFKNHSYNDIENQFEIYFGTYSLNFKNDTITSELKVLEIGSGQGNFAYFCQKMGVTYYTGIEIDSDMAKHTQKIFPAYTIESGDAIQYFENNTEKYDIIFSSHVFEHFSIEDGIHLVTLIKGHLTDNTGRWINIMPNAGSIMAGLGRYNDITHKVLYTENSFNQVLKIAGFQKEKIEHRNSLVVEKRGLVRLVSRVLLFIFRFICILIQLPFPRIFTFEIYSIIKN